MAPDAVGSHVAELLPGIQAALQVGGGAGEGLSAGIAGSQVAFWAAHAMCPGVPSTGGCPIDCAACSHAPMCRTRPAPGPTARCRPCSSSMQVGSLERNAVVAGGILVPVLQPAGPSTRQQPPLRSESQPDSPIQPPTHRRPMAPCSHGLQQPCRLPALGGAPVQVGVCCRWGAVLQGKGPACEWAHVMLSWCAALLGTATSAMFQGHGMAWHGLHLPCRCSVAQVAAEALRVCEQLVRVIRPDVAAPVPDAMQASGAQRGRPGCLCQTLTGGNVDQRPANICRSTVAAGAVVWSWCPFCCACTHPFHSNPSPQGLVRPLYDVVMARLSAQVGLGWREGPLQVMGSAQATTADRKTSGRPPVRSASWS